ncbi:hypothetical protein CROQUDRAFT_98261, partial [Cronartium quercuum f. sp. fusiforme G11]
MSTSGVTRRDVTRLRHSPGIKSRSRLGSGFHIIPLCSRLPPVPKAYCRDSYRYIVIQTSFLCVPAYLPSRKLTVETLIGYGP